MTSQNFSSKRLSLDSLKVRERCGLMSLAAHRRCTLAGDTLAARAIVRQLHRPRWGAASPPAPALAAPRPAAATACARARRDRSTPPTGAAQSDPPSGSRKAVKSPVARRCAVGSDLARLAG